MSQPIYPNCSRCGFPIHQAHAGMRDGSQFLLWYHDDWMRGARCGTAVYDPKAFPACPSCEQIVTVSWEAHEEDCIVRRME